MKKIQHAQVDDFGNLAVLKQKYPSVTSRVVSTIRNQYGSYANNSGNPWVVLRHGKSVFTDDQKSELGKAYKSKAANFSYIEAIRYSSPNVCPMCGSSSAGEVDHYLSLIHI